MNEEGVNAPLERFSKTEFSSSESTALAGLDYDSLPNTFELSEQVLACCNSVRNSKPKIDRSVVTTDEFKQAYISAQKHFAKNADEDKPFDEGDMNRTLNRLEETTTEFSRQLYSDGSEVVIGALHQGYQNLIYVLGSLDGIADNKTLVYAHKHPRNVPQSLEDMRNIVVDLDMVPRLCLFIAVGP